MDYVGRIKSCNLEVAEGWTKFWFESNQIWGWVNGPEDWEMVKKVYPDCDLGVVAKEAPEYGAAIMSHYYGFRIECKGPKTLGEFFAEHGMEI